MIGSNTAISSRGRKLTPLAIILSLLILFLGLRYEMVSKLRKSHLDENFWSSCWEGRTF